MLNWMFRLDRLLEIGERCLAIGLFGLLIGLICVNIFTRNILHWASHDLIEISPAVVLWLALVGATLALKHRRHIKIELLLRFLPPGAQRMAMGLTGTFAIGLCGLLFVSSLAFVRNEIVLFGVQGWVAVCFPVFFGVALFRFGLQLLESIGRTRENRP